MCRRWARAERWFGAHHFGDGADYLETAFAGAVRETLGDALDPELEASGWMLDHDEASMEMISRAFAGGREGFQGCVLHNVRLYWLTDTASSSAQLYWDTANNLPPGGFFDVRRIQLGASFEQLGGLIFGQPAHAVLEGRR